MANTIYLTGVPGPAGVLDVPSFGQFPIDVGANAVNIHAARGLGYLLRAGVIDPNNPTLIQGPPYPAGFWDVPTGFEVGFAGGRSTIYPAASLGHSSKPSDTPANTYVPGKVININYGVRLFTGIEPSPQGAGGLGAIVLPDPRGDLDSYIDLAWDGAILDILRGQPLALFNTYSVVARMTAAGILYDQRHKELRLRDLGWQLAAGELHGLRYGGTGGTDGDAAVAGQMKPYGVGVVTNATPVKIGATLECYQFSCSSIQSVDAVRDGGVAKKYALLGA